MVEFLTEVFILEFLQYGNGVRLDGVWTYPTIMDNSGTKIQNIKTTSNTLKLFIIQTHLFPIHFTLNP